MAKRSKVRPIRPEGLEPHARDVLLPNQPAPARQAGIRAETLNRIEQGKHSPTLRTMQKIERALRRGEVNGKT